MSFPTTAASATWAGVVNPPVDKMDASEESTTGRRMNIDSSVRQSSLFKISIAVSYLLSGDGSNKSHRLQSITFLSPGVFLLGHGGHCRIY